MQHTLEVYHGATMVFSSDGRWLHPLFELGDFLKASGVAPAELSVHDKVVGCAAAMLIVHMGIGEVHAAVLSRLGQAVLARFGVPCDGEVVVERMACQTEDLLRNVEDPAEAYAILARRAGRAG